MKNEIAYWLKQIVEDDPLSYELKHVVFIINNKVLSVGAYEILPDIIYEPEFYPLESQYIFYNHLYMIENDNVIFSAIETEVDEAFYDEELKKLFEGKKIYLAKFGKMPKFLFDV